MKNSLIIRNGLYGGAVLLGINLIMLVFVGTDPAYFDIAEVIGYSTIILCLAFVFVGIRQYELTSESSDFISRLGIGTGISLFPSLVFGIYNVIYVLWVDPEFNKKYLQHSLEKMEASMSLSEFEIAKAELIEQQAMFDSIPVQFLVMFLTVFVIGLIISILSSLYFQLKPIRK